MASTAHLAAPRPGGLPRWAKWLVFCVTLLGLWLAYTTEMHRQEEVRIERCESVTQEIRDLHDQQYNDAQVLAELPRGLTPEQLTSCHSPLSDLVRRDRAHQLQVFLAGTRKP